MATREMQEEVSDVVRIAGYVRWGVIGIAAIVLFWGSFFIVGPGEVGVTFNRLSGVTQSHSQGIHFKLPVLTSIDNFDVKTMRVDIQCESASKDLQKVTVHSVSNIHLKYDMVNELYVKVGKDYIDKVVFPAVNESVKSASAQFPVESIIVSREALKETIEKSLTDRLLPYNIVLESLNLVNISFDDDFNKVVEEKQIEEQKIKTTEYKRQQAMNEKKTAILQAEAQAEAQRLLKQNVNKEIIELRWIEKWDGELPQIMSGNSGMLMNIPQLKGKNKESSEE